MSCPPLALHHPYPPSTITLTYCCPTPCAWRLIRPIALPSLHPQLFIALPSLRPQLFIALPSLRQQQLSQSPSLQTVQTLACLYLVDSQLGSQILRNPSCKGNACRCSLWGSPSSARRPRPEARHLRGKGSARRVREKNSGPVGSEERKRFPLPTLGWPCRIKNRLSGR